LGVSREKITVIPPGVGAAEIAAMTREEWLAQLELPADARLIGVADSLDAQSKTKEAIWAAELVYVLHKNSCLLVFGDGPRRGQLERFAGLVDAENRVRFLGNRAAAARLFGLLDVFWSCGERDPTPPALLQAIASAVPVVASDIPGREQLIVDNKTGFLAGVGSRTGFARPTDRLFQDAELARRIGDAGRQHVADAFSIEQMIDRYVELYRDL
jgi:glycosyltransferase involved in cell wall biosynthesis